MKALPALAALAALAAVALAGCASHPVVHVRDFRFEPDGVRISAGGGVTFASDGPSPHGVVVHAPDGAVVVERDIATGESFDVPFPKAGVYHAFCPYHEGMEAVVTVR